MPFELSIVTPQGESYHGSVESVVLPGSEGAFGVLPAHERFLTPLRIGAVEIRTGAETLYAAIADGFAEVGAGRVVVLVEGCELAHEIDVARAELDRDRAREGLAEAGVPVTVEADVSFGHRLAKWKHLVDEHDASLLVMNAKDEDQDAMHGLAHPIAIEMRQVPRLML